MMKLQAAELSLTAPEPAKKCAVNHSHELRLASKILIFCFLELV